MNNYLTKIIVAISFFLPFMVFAAPGIPHQFYGTATYTNGTNITSGNVIVKIGATQVASVPISNGKYGYNPSLLFITDSNNDRVGQTLKFFINNIDTSATTVFTSGEYTELNLSIVMPSDTITSDGTDVSLSSTITGKVDMPIGATNVILTNTTVIDLSIGLSGDAVTLNSGVSGNPIVLANSNLSGINASIPDGTKIQGPIGWNGKITPPISGTPSGIAPAGFSVGSTVISIGSSDGTLIFDKSVTILLTGVTGTVGYKPSGSDTWTQITNTCGGSYITPTAPAAPGECAISNGTDTKIVTYHFTSFGSLTSNPPPLSPGGTSPGGSSGPLTPPVTLQTPLSEAAQIVDTNGDDKIDVMDFNSLVVNWGITESDNIADFDNNGTVDIFDFNLLMTYWTG